MRILLTGATGQIGRELAALLGEHELYAPTHAECDLADAASVRAAVRGFHPDLILNPAAYTAVDRAEEEPELAQAINADAPAILADEARRIGIPLIHFSTDYVFSGAARSPYTEVDPTGPLNVYGRTKLAGEEAVTGSGCIHLILRTSWVYSRHGRNFLLTIERLAREKPELSIVDDQFGTPNWACALARAATRLAVLPRDELSEKSGLYHLTGAGQATWHQFAVAIVDSMNLPKPPPVHAIRSVQYPTPAKRPAYAVLSASKLGRNFGIALSHWEDALKECQSRS
ncbi:MAG: dTDP-4-dehydrorhamnose reductase [Casimicrobiaceae bacterium]